MRVAYPSGVRGVRVAYPSGVRDRPEAYDDIHSTLFIRYLPLEHVTG